MTIYLTPPNKNFVSQTIKDFFEPPEAIKFYILPSNQSSEEFCPAMPENEKYGAKKLLNYDTQSFESKPHSLNT